MNDYPLTSLVTLVLIGLGWQLGTRVSKARAAFAEQRRDSNKQHSLRVYSDPDFMIAFRNHLNLIEHLVLFLPTLWIFALTISDGLAFILGLAYLLGRVLYAINYSRGHSHRPGFLISYVSMLVLLTGALGSTILEVWTYFRGT